MRILLLGEASRVHSTLRDALAALGHDVVLMSGGNGRNDCPRDVDLSRDMSRGKTGGLRVLLTLLRHLPRLVGNDVVQILSTVEMKNVKTGMVMKYTIVSESEANLREGKISSTTPIAQGLLGRKVGEVVEVKIPQGTIQLEILNITVG